MAAMESDGINSSMQACKHEALRPLLGPAATAAPAPPVMSKAAAFDTEPLSPPTWHTPCYGALL